MGTLLSSYATSRDNNFNLLRFIAALLVLYTHSFALAIGAKDAQPLRAMLGMTWGTIAVDIFFITSGFLITSSYISRNNIIAFVWARILRIYPALIVAVIFCVFILGVWFTKLTIWEFLSNTLTHKFILKNTVLFTGIEYKLPGVFNDNPWRSAVNGSLWTLPHEVRMYAILPVILMFIAVLGKKIRSVTAKNGLFIVVLFAANVHVVNHFQPILPKIFVRLFFMFFVGAAFYVWRDRIRLVTSWFFAALLLLLLSTMDKDVYFIFYTLLLPYLVFYVAYVPSGGVRKFNRIGDYSYGLYIYAFPVQQSLAAMIPGIPVSTMIIYSFSLTLLLSILSWHIIEKN